MRRGIRRALLVLIAVIYALSIPWYRLTDSGVGAEPEIWFGLPDWVAVALICYLAAALLNAVAWYFTDIPEVAGAEPEAGDS